MSKYQKAIKLLQDLIRIQSFSTKEDKTANRIEKWFVQYEIPFNRSNNNLWATNKFYDKSKPTLLLNSHHDTVEPNKGYRRDPFSPDIEDGKLYGLGSNDAGGALVSLISTFTEFYHHPNMSHNLIMAATGEEEIAGENSLKGLLKIIPKVDLAIVGEPTLLKIAIAERGLLVVDATIEGTSSHAAHPNLDNPIFKLASFLNQLKEIEFEKNSSLLGEVKITPTGIEVDDMAHNVVPSHVHLVLDIRVNEHYSNQEVFHELQKTLPYNLSARSFDLRSSSISLNHPLVKSCIDLGKKTYGSPTLSDMAALSCPGIKLGPGDSTRSHTADEFIFIHEIKDAIDFYGELLTKFLLT